MKIGKSFEMVVSGKYQSYRFSTSLEQEFSEDMKREDIVISSEDLQTLAVELTFNDIEMHKLADSDFAAVWSAREKDLAQFRYMQNKSNGAKPIEVKKVGDYHV